MFFLNSRKIVLTIENTKPGTIVSRRRQWNVRIKLKDTIPYLNPLEHFIKDPFESERDRKEVAQYLDKTLERDLEETSAQETWQKIDKYRKTLFNSLRLVSGYLKRLEGFNVEIQIRQLAPAEEDLSFHSIHWEHLEDINLWTSSCWPRRTGPASVTVRRMVQEIRQTSPAHRRTSELVPNKKIEIFNVLLVVARKHLYNTIKVDYFNPTSVQSALLLSKEALESRGSYQRIRLEVVRPGSFEELESHLKRRHENGDHPFHVVHFDMHGTVSLRPGGDKASLMFNSDNLIERSIQDDVTEVDSGELAKLLLKYGVDCAVLSACKSAKADAKVGANLSWSFLDAGMSSVLAMSYNMPDSMSKIFCGRFYYELFIREEEFASAATKARIELRKNPLRWSYHSKDWVPLQDWFIPVVYSNGKPWKIEHGEGMRSTIQLIWLAMLLLAPWLALNLKAMYAPKYTIFHRATILTPRRSIIDLLDSKSIQCFLSIVLNCLFMAYYFNFPFGQWKQWRFNNRLKTIDHDRKNILRIEVELKRSRKIFLHTSNDMDNSAQQLLDSLTDIWRRTHLVEHRVLIDAKWFIRHFEADNVLAMITGIAWLKSFAHMLMMSKVYLSPGMRHLLSSAGENRARTVVVIYNVNSLYPEDFMLQNYHLLAQQRFIAWLEKYFTTNEMETISWYLVIVGEGQRAWVNKTLDTCAALDATAITEYTNPRNFPHNPEKPLPPRSWL
ncbi:hypothetical protein EG329_005155 [Mollisiaceae sp. DMI_Dod_QoI]|nr:hypothetical protein EG329_005155 [Helotiales sp. DMI_Dod_QoI]